MSFEWPIDRSCLPALAELGDAPTEEEQAAHDLAVLRRGANEDVAVAVLWALSGRQFGLYDTIVRPCPAYVVDPFSFTWWGLPYILTFDAGHWANWPCGCIGRCSVSGPRVVHLPGPVSAITTVTVEGVDLDEDAYQLEGDALYRTVGAHWPRQNLGAPLGEAGTWSVTYQRGIPVPAGVDTLTGLLAKEFIAACDGSGKCRLPRTVVSTTARGVTHSFDPAKMLGAGKTGLPEVDLWLAAVNPNHLIEAPVVL